jgi:hypothetical protein
MHLHEHNLIVQDTPILVSGSPANTRGSSSLETRFWHDEFEAFSSAGTEE